MIVERVVKVIRKSGPGSFKPLADAPLSRKQHYFPALARLDQFKSLRKVFQRKGVSDDGTDVEARFEQARQAIPSAE